MSRLAKPSIYESCHALVDPSASELDQLASTLQCIGQSNANSIDVFFLIYASSLVFFMQAGFAMLCAGCVQLKNVQNSMLKNLLDACGAALGFYSIGYAFAYGGSDFENPQKTFIGTSNFFLIGVDNLMFWLFQFAFAASSATIVAGTLAERCQMAAYLCYSMTLTGFVYPVVAHSIWSPQGFLSADSVNPLWGVGVIDFAGSAVVHLTGGTTAIIATYLLGPRRGRFYDHRGQPLEIPKEFPGHSAALQMLGTFILWFGWYGFNTGSALSITGPEQEQVVSLVAVNTTLSAASGCISALMLNYIIDDRRWGEGSFSLSVASNGCLSGLVSITGACAVVDPWSAVVIGFVAGILYLASSKLLVRLRLDDVVDAIPVHFTNGAWGTISTGLFAQSDLISLAYRQTISDQGIFMGGSGTLFGTQLLCVVINVGWICAVMVPFFFALNYMGWLRASSADEVEGLDSIYHGGKRSESFGEEPRVARYGEGNRRIRRRIRQQSNCYSSRNALIRQQSHSTARTSTAEGEEQIQKIYPQAVVP